MKTENVVRYDTGWTDIATTQIWFKRTLFFTFVLWKKI